MSTFLIIMAVILWVGLKGYRKIKQAFPDPGEASSAPQQQARPVRPAVETLFEEPASATSSGSPYFSYETMEAKPAEPKCQKQPKQSNQKPQPELQPEPAVQAEPKSAFDLRQAVIYQTILQNDYISDYQR